MTRERSNPVVSASRLVGLIREGRLTPSDRADVPGEPIHLGTREVAELIVGWRQSVEVLATQMAKRSTGTLEALAEDCVYQRLSDPNWRRAAGVCEVFRSPSVAKNAGWLDVRRLQSRLVTAIEAGRLHFELAWGQAKRPAGGLKTAGPHSDLAELYSLARLAALIEATRSQVPGIDVHLTIRSGTLRYASALLVDQGSSAYDDQRQRIADAMSPTKAITVSDFVWPDPPDVTGARWEDHLRRLTDQRISDNLPNVLLNVDWARIISALPEVPIAHGLDLPAEVRDWLAEKPPRSAATLTRAAVTTVINPRYRDLWLETIDCPGSVLDATTWFVSTVAWEATRRYLSSHAVGAGQDSADDTSIRLTVHEKRNRPDIPALLTLGRSGRDLLAQHVAVSVSPDGDPSFDTVAEIAAENPPPRPVVPTRGEDGPPELFGWLADGGQPLCFADAADGPVTERISRIVLHG